MINRRKEKKLNQIFFFKFILWNYAVQRPRNHAPGEAAGYFMVFWQKSFELYLGQTGAGDWRMNFYNLYGRGVKLMAHCPWYNYIQTMR